MLDLAFEDGSFDVVIEKGAIEVCIMRVSERSSSLCRPCALCCQRVA